MFAIPPLLALLFFVYIRPQEIWPVLQRVPLLYVLVLLALLALALDVRLAWSRVVRNPGAAVSVQVYSPFQRALDQAIADDAALRQRSGADPNTVYLRMDDVKGLRDALHTAGYRVLNEIKSRQAIDELLMAEVLKAFSGQFSRLIIAPKGL